MRRAMRVLFLGFWLAAATPAFSHAAAQAPDRCYLIGVLVDPAQPAADVAHEMARLRASAEDGGDFAAFLLGTFYRLGPKHPAARLPQDGALAREWLHRSALGGNLGALAGLVELDLAGGRPMDALVHALVQVHFGRKYPDAAYSSHRARTGSQVNRAFDALGQPRSEALDAEILALVNAFVARHGEAIDSALQAAKARSPLDPCVGREVEPGVPLERKGASDVMAPAWSPQLGRDSYALFHLSIDPKGRVEKALVVDYWPDEQALEAQRKIAEGMRFNKLRGVPKRVALLPVKLRS